MTLHRYWIRFEPKESGALPPGLALGCGVTALNREDAIRLLREKVFFGRELAAIEEIIEDIDISTLDPGHVIPNMGVSIRRGIWFPLGYT